MSTLGGRKTQDVFGEGGVLGILEVKLIMVLAIVRCVGELGESSILIATRNVTGKDRKIHLETTTEVQVQAEVQM